MKPNLSIMSTNKEFGILCNKDTYFHIEQNLNIYENINPTFSSSVNQSFD